MAETVALRQLVLDCPAARRLAEFYRELLGFAYRPGDEPPGPGEPDPRGRDWLVLRIRPAGYSLPSNRLTTCRNPPGPRGRTHRWPIWI